MYDILQEFKTKTTFISVGTIIRAAMCVADGEFTSAVFPGKQHKNCDVAAVKVIVEEAGGIVTDFYGNDQRYDRDINGAVITNGVVHDEILEAIKKHI
jgi:fructose-1,6-bisphosphatase/inositol monophosphatase family enzyme